MLATLLLAACLTPQVPPPPVQGGDPRLEPRPATPAAAPRIEVVADGEARRILVDGEAFTVYRSAPDAPTPVLFPVLGPGQVDLTRRWPLAEAAPGEAEDHPHHRSLWFAHGAVNGHDFWHGTGSKDVIVHAGWLPVAKDDRGRAIHARNRWVADDGSVVCTDRRYLRFGVDESGNRSIDYRVTVFASEGDVVFGDTKEGTMAIRLAPGLRLRGAVANGRILDDRGRTDAKCWGKRSAWVAYSGPARVAGTSADAAGHEVTVVLMDHPRNPRHPTWWHARDYGLLAANPFGQHDFEGGEKGAGELRLPEGESLTFTYRFWFLSGPADADELAARYRAFARATFSAPASQDDDR